MPYTFAGVTMEEKIIKCKNVQNGVKVCAIENELGKRQIKTIIDDNIRGEIHGSAVRQNKAKLQEELKYEVEVLEVEDE